MLFVCLNTFLLWYFIRVWHQYLYVFLWDNSLQDTVLHTLIVSFGIWIVLKKTRNISNNKSALSSSTAIICHWTRSPPVLYHTEWYTKWACSKACRIYVIQLNPLQNSYDKSSHCEETINTIWTPLQQPLRYKHFLKPGTWILHRRCSEAVWDGPLSFPRNLDANAL